MGVCTRAHHLERTGETPAQELTGGEGGEDTDEGRGLGFEAPLLQTSQASSPPREGTWIGHGKGGLYSIFMERGLYREAAS